MEGLCTFLYKALEETKVEELLDMCSAIGNDIEHETQWTTPYPIICDKAQLEPREKYPMKENVLV